MAREKGVASFSANFEPQVAAPLDARLRVGLKTDLLLPATWEANDGGNYIYLGITVSVYNDTVANNGVYVLNAIDYTSSSSWTKVGGLNWITDETVKTNIKNESYWTDGVYDPTKTAGLVAWDYYAEGDWSYIYANGVLKRTRLTSEMQAIGVYTKHDTGIPSSERIKFNTGTSIVTATGVSWSRQAAELVVTSAGHGFLANDTITITVSSDITAIPLANYTIIEVTDDTFTFAVGGSGGVSGTLSYKALRMKLVLNGGYTSFTYFKENKPFVVDANNIAKYSQSKAIVKGTWFFYIQQTTIDAADPKIALTQTAWSIVDPDILLFNCIVDSTLAKLDMVGEERHTAGRDIFQHARNHFQGAVRGTGFGITTSNGLTTLTTNDNSYARAQLQVQDGFFFDEDIRNTIVGGTTAAIYNSNSVSPAYDWNLTISQYLGFTAVNTSVVNTTITFGTPYYMATGQAVTVMQGNTTTLRGVATVTSVSGSSTSHAITAVTGLANGDVIVVGARIPIYYISAVSPYTWTKFTTSDFLGVSGATLLPYTAANIGTAVPSVPQVNNATTGALVNMANQGRYYPVYLMATNSVFEPIVAILGQGQSVSSTLSTALTEAAFQFNNLVGLSSLGIQEVVPFARLTFEYNTSPSFTVAKIKLRDVTQIDIRVSTASGSVINTGGSVSVLHDNTLIGSGNSTGQLKVVGNDLYLSVPILTYHSTGYLYKETYTYRNDAVQTLEKRYSWTGTKLTLSQINDTASGYFVERTYTYTLDILTSISESPISSFTIIQV